MNPDANSNCQSLLNQSSESTLTWMLDYGKYAVVCLPCKDCVRVDIQIGNLVKWVQSYRKSTENTLEKEAEKCFMTVKEDAEKCAANLEKKFEKGIRLMGEGNGIGKCEFDARKALEKCSVNLRMANFDLKETWKLFADLNQRALKLGESSEKYAPNLKKVSEYAGEYVATVEEDAGKCSALSNFEKIFGEREMKACKGLEQRVSKFEILEERVHPLNVDKDARKIVSDVEKNCGEGEKRECDLGNRIINKEENIDAKFPIDSKSIANKYGPYHDNGEKAEQDHQNKL